MSTGEAANHGSYVDPNEVKALLEQGYTITSQVMGCLGMQVDSICPCCNEALLKTSPRARTRYSRSLRSGDPIELAIVGEKLAVIRHPEWSLRRWTKASEVA